MQMTGIFRGVAYAAWMLAFGLSIWLAVEFHEYHIGIALGVAILALILSAFGLLMARSCGQQKDRLAMTIGIVLWAAGAISFAITELGFWSSSYKDRHAEYVQVKTAKARQEGMKDMAWDALRTGEMRASTAEIEARIKAARQSELYASSAGCTNATARKSREFCGSYYELEAKLASAGKMETLEARLLGDKTDAKQTMVHNVFAAADLIAENSTFTEKQAATIVVLTIALVLMLARDLLLIVANPFGGATAALGSAKASDPISVAPAPVAAVLRDPPAIPVRFERKPITPMIELPEFNSSALPQHSSALSAKTEESDPDGPGTPIAKPEEPKIEVAEDPKIVRPAVWHEESAPPVAPRTNGKRQRNHLNRKDQTVIQWLGDCCSITDDSTHIATGRQCFASYKHYCDARRISEKDRVPQNRMSTLLSGQLGTRIDGRGKRNGNGAVFPGLMINPIAAQARRRVA
jgi:hypothetical protein